MRCFKNSRFLYMVRHHVPGVWSTVVPRVPRFDKKDDRLVGLFVGPTTYSCRSVTGSDISKLRTKHPASVVPSAFLGSTQPIHDGPSSLTSTAFSGQYIAEHLPPVQQLLQSVSSWQTSHQRLFYRSAPSSISSTDKAMGGDIQLFTFPTPNGQKVSIALEELGLPYEAHKVDISKGDQFKPEFLAVNPNSKIPAITDPHGPDGEPLHLFESGAILLYLAEKTGKLLPKDARLKWETIQWVFFQMAGVGPMFGQFGHFAKFAKDKCDHPYPAERYKNESIRLMGVLEKRLEGRNFLAGDEYTIADIASYPWVQGFRSYEDFKSAIDFDKFPSVTAWLDRIGERPATQKGMKVPS